MSGLLVGGVLVPVDGVKIVSPGEEPGCSLTSGKDCKPRTNRPQQLILHKTIADDPEKILAGAGPAGGAKKTADYWRSCDGKTNPYRNAGAHGVTGEDGVVWNLVDLIKVEVFHATVSNLISIGWETREVAGGGVYQASLDATVLTAIAICRAVGIQLQVPHSYNGHPLHRMLNGGHDVVGVLGHRDNTEERGEWDPGNILFGMLRAHGAEAFDFANGEDIATWKARQLSLNAKGHTLTIDGIPGPATTAALRAEGYIDGIWALGRAA